MEAISLLLGTYAITLTLTQSEGPWGILYRIRNNERVKDFGLLDCFLCLSLWASIVLCVAFERLDLVLFAWSGAVVLDKLITAYMTK